MTEKTKPKKAPRVKNTSKPLSRAQLEIAVKNGLQAAILGFDTGSLGTELNQIDTLFNNQRWYLLSNFRQLISEAYIEHGVIQTVVDLPVDDAFRGGIEIHTKQLDPEEIEELQVVMAEHEDLEELAQANKWNRLFGGAGLMLMVDGQDYAKPLNIQAINKDTPIRFKAYDLWELFSNQQAWEPGEPGFTPGFLSYDYEFYNVYSHKVHRSFVKKLKGIEAPSFIRPRLRGWGISIVEVMVNSINQYLKANNVIFEVLDEFKVDVYRIKNLTNTLLNPSGDQLIRKRIALANQQKNFQNAITMDSEDEFQQKELNFTGIAETMLGVKMHIAADVRFPIAKMFGTGSTGFASGEDDIENYNSMVEGQVRTKTKNHAMFMVKLRCQQIFGHIPDDLRINFKPLRVLSAEQEETVKTAKHSRLLATQAAGLCTPEEFKEGCNKDQLLPVQLDTSIDIIDTGDGDDEKDEDGTGEKPAAKKSQTAPKEPKEVKS